MLKSKVPLGNSLDVVTVVSPPLWEAAAESMIDVVWYVNSSPTGWEIWPPAGFPSRHRSACAPA
jgi:hypothetical protein